MDKARKTSDVLQTTLSSSIGDIDTTIPLSSAVGVDDSSEIDIVIDRVDDAGNETPEKMEVITVQIVENNGTNAVRGRAGSAQPHDAGAVVEFNVATSPMWNDLMDMLREQHDTATGAHTEITAQSIVVNGRVTATEFRSTSGEESNGWTIGLATPDAVTYNGNRSYSLVFNSVNLSDYLSNGMKLRLSRAVAAPTQCTSLNGSSHYFSKPSPANMTFTDDFVISAWVKLNNYGSDGAIVSRYNGTSGWFLIVNADGSVRLVGRNAGSSNSSQILSQQSIPTGKWVHIAAQLDMSAFTATATTSYIMIDGVNVPAVVSRGGTNPTALIQAGDLQIGASNSGAFFSGKIAQVAIFNAKVTQGTMRSYISQGLTGSEASLVSAYSMNNTLNDLNTTNANNLTAQSGAVATSADSPFGDSATSGTFEYGIVMGNAFSTDTTLTVQVPEGCAIPTSGGVSAVAYSPQGVPNGFPSARNKWAIESIYRIDSSKTSPAAGTWYGGTGLTVALQLEIPIGDWETSYQAVINGHKTGALAADSSASLSTSTSSELDPTMTTFRSIEGASSTMQLSTPVSRSGFATPTAQTTYYLITKTGVSSMAAINFIGAVSPTIIRAECAHL